MVLPELQTGTGCWDFPSGSPGQPVGGAFQGNVHEQSGAPAVLKGGTTAGDTGK